MLSELVRFYNQLCALSMIPAKQSTDTELQHIIQLSQHSALADLRSDIIDSFDRFETEFDSLKKRIYDQIREQEKPYLQDSYVYYEQNRSWRYYDWYMESVDEAASKQREENIKIYLDRLLNNRLPMTDQVQDQILNRITRVSGWQNTAMILHPGLESWIHHMVSNDPMYLVDESHELLKPALQQFNEQYQSRLRPYVVREDLDQDILWQLPDDQFGLVLAWNFFNHRPFEIIRRYLTELYKKMRPGGMLLMTYNDCDRWEGVKAVEAKAALYTPGLLMQSFAKSLGFKINFVYAPDGPWTWIEFQKPGEWQSLRGGQCLAKILPKPIAESK